MSMTKSEFIPKWRYWCKRIIISLAIILGVVLVWHLCLSFDMSNRIRSHGVHGSASDEMLSISINPLTNLISITIVMPPDPDGSNPFSALGSTLVDSMFHAIGPGLTAIIDEKLNTQAREKFDLYAMLVPYRVHLSTKKATPEAFAKIQEEREKRRAEEAKVKLQSIRAYAAANLLLKNVQVSQGERFGKTVDSVFGTIENNGTKTLSKVTVRFYFLDSARKRIGEKDFSPVLVSKYSFDDNTPLRPGYRKDFGYSVEDKAPSGWVKQVEAEIVEMKFLDE